MTKATKTTKTTNHGTTTTVTALAPAPTLAPTPGVITDPLSGLKFHSAPAPKAKADPTRARCSHGAGTDKACQLYPFAGGADPSKCINHQAPVSRLTRDEAETLLAYVDQLQPADKLELIVGAMGWYKAKELAKYVQATQSAA